MIDKRYEIQIILLYSTQNKKISEYIQSKEFRRTLTVFPSLICFNCGKEYKITHWCDSKKIQDWISSWDVILYESFKAHLKEVKNERKRERKSKREYKKYQRRQKKIRKDETKKPPNENKFDQKKKHSSIGWILWIIILIILGVSSIIALDNLSTILEFFN
ncbi:MAG: hypothetical protein EU530_02235 [Promethearchaeota archaeon]|nr:MAG: hypothetical protein EU530_02235 [Candidatus Lokiarchaeota archaeon]